MPYWIVANISRKFSSKNPKSLFVEGVLPVTQKSRQQSDAKVSNCFAIVRVEKDEKKNPEYRSQLSVS